MLAYSFGLPTDAWNQKSLNSPLPCSNGIYCQIERCISVHPGEEGLKRKYFPGREVEKDGKMVMQNPCVRLVGRDKTDVPGYYKRRMQKLSWPDWCKQEGIPLPRSPQDIVRAHLPFWSPPSLYSHVFQGSTVPALLQHFALPNTPGAVNKVSGYLLRCELMKHRSIVERQADYMCIISIAARYSPDDILIGEYGMADQLIGSILAATHMHEQTARTAFGNALYTKVADILAKSEQIARDNKLWVEGFTAGKATGMIMEYIGEPRPSLLENSAELEDMLSQCMVEYAPANGGFI